MNRHAKHLYAGTIALGGLLASSCLWVQSASAQLFYPPAAGPQIVAVTGQGRARVPADRAVVDVVVTNQDPEEQTFPEAPRPTPRPQQKPITAAALNPIVETLKAAGVPSDKIKVNINPIPEGRFSYRRASSSVTIQVDRPTPERVTQIVDRVNTAITSVSAPSKLYLDGVYVQYAVNSCEAVENAAYSAAMNDAKLRANAVAKAMGVELAPTPSVAELPFLGRFYSPCSQEEGITEALFRRPASPYNPATPAVVEVFRELAVTYRPR